MYFGHSLLANFGPWPPSLNEHMSKQIAFVSLVLCTDKLSPEIVPTYTYVQLQCWKLHSYLPFCFLFVCCPSSRYIVYSRTIAGQEDWREMWLCPVVIASKTFCAGSGQENNDRPIEGRERARRKKTFLSTFPLLFFRVWYPFTTSFPFSCHSSFCLPRYLLGRYTLRRPNLGRSSVQYA